jgi:hypothetical protein
MEQNRTMGYFLMATGALVLVPIVLQLRSGEYGLRDVLGYLIFVVGLFTVGIGYAFLEGTDQRRLALAGLGAVLVGLLVVQFTERRSQHGSGQ